MQSTQPGDAATGSDADAITTTDGTADADAIATDAPAGKLTVDLLFPSVSWCKCHHGFGPGLDGLMTFTAKSTAATAIKVELLIVRLVPTAGGPTYSTADGGSVQFKTPAGTFSSITVDAGATVNPQLKLIIDTTVSDPPPSTPYDIEVTYTEDGVKRVVLSGPLSISVAS